MSASSPFMEHVHEKSRADLQKAADFLQQGQVAAAQELCGRLCESHPDWVDAWSLRSHISQRLNCFDDMLASAARASELAPGSTDVQLRLLECNLYCGQPQRTRKALPQLEASALSDHRLLCRLAEMYTHCVDHEGALRCYQRAVQLQPRNANYLFSLSATQLALGHLRAAEKTLDLVVRFNPHDYDAYRNRATLRKQTPQSNHVAEMLSLLNAGVQRPAGEVQLCYALSKEYEDLGDFENAFACLKRGADKRRSLLSYKVENDVAVIDRIMETFNSSVFDNAAHGLEQQGPIFIVGLPRSGTTLIDRIVSSHSAVTSLGEINDFAFSLLHTAGTSRDKMHLVELAGQLNYAKLGRRYIDGVRNYEPATAYFIDKTPLNFLYLGLIRLALPYAKVLHIQRNPMDACYGMYRTLFRAGYPFSYDLADLATYYLAYRRLMHHWRELCGGWFLDLSYEELVDDQEGVSRRIIEFCGLEWQPACLEFHNNAAPVATASSAQVREPVNRDALHRWRHYARQLDPLAGRLRAGGIDIGKDR